MKISVLKRQGLTLAVLEDQSRAATLKRRARSSTTGINWHAGPTSTLGRPARWADELMEGPKRLTGACQWRDWISQFLILIWISLLDRFYTVWRFDERDG